MLWKMLVMSGKVEIVVEMVLSQLVGFVFVEIGVENGWKIMFVENV